MSSLSRRAAIIGAFEHPTRKAEGLNEMQFAAEAARGALADAGLEPGDIDGLFTPPMLLEGGPLGPGAALTMADYLGLRPRFLEELEVGGASFGYYLTRAVLAIEAGLMDTALILYAAQPRTNKRNIGTERVAAMRATPDSFEQVYGVPLVGFYGLLAERYMRESGLTREQLAQVPVVTRANAALNGAARYRDPITVADVLESPEIASPLRVLDCCVITDGAAAVIVTGAERARDAGSRAAWVLGFGEGTMGHGAGRGDWVEDTVGMIEAASSSAFSMAEIDREEVDAAMIYDAFSINVPMALEGAGFVARDEVGDFLAAGEIGPDGRLPINTDGGGLSSNHPGRRGLFLLVEAVRQLRGESPGAQLKDPRRVATVATGAASMARRVSAVHLLGKESA